MRYLSLALLAFWLVGSAQEIALSPTDAASLGSWAQVSLPLRLYPTPANPVTDLVPALVTRLFGEIALGTARYVFLLGVNAQNEVGLWVDFNGDGSLREGERVLGTRIDGGILWSLVLYSKPSGSTPFEYPLQVLWPVGRGYVFLVGGAPRRGAFQSRLIAVVDGDLDGVFGTKGDFLGVDVDGDGVVYAELDGHERFSISEAFTLGPESFRLQALAADGRRIWVERTAYVSPKVPLIPGSPAPNFVFQDFASGRELSLQSFRGKVVLLDFWATWCPPCMAALPEIRRVYAEFHSRGFEIVGVSLDESAEELRGVLREQGITWPIAFAGKRWDNPIASLYRVSQIPTTYLLDETGIIRYRNLEGEALRAALDELLGEGMAEGSAAEGGAILALEAPERISLVSGASPADVLRVHNPSAYVAQEVRVSLEGAPPGIYLFESEPFDLPPQGDHWVRLGVSPEALAPLGSGIPLVVHVDYRYCVDTACFEVGQTAQTEVVVEGGPPPPSPPRPWWNWAVLAAGALVVLWLFGSLLLGVASLPLLLGLAGRMLWKW